MGKKLNDKTKNEKGALEERLQRTDFVDLFQIFYLRLRIVSLDYCWVIGKILNKTA